MSRELVAPEGSIRACSDCPRFGGDDGCFMPTDHFVMGIEQVTVPKSERVGYPVVAVSYRAAREDDLGVSVFGDFAPRFIDGDIYAGEVAHEDWEEIYGNGCSGPVEGARRFRIAGSRVKICPVDEAIKQADTR